MAKPKVNLAELTCDDASGLWDVRIDRNRCEGKEDCAKVCPEGVFEIRRLDDEEFAALDGWFTRFRVRVHGKRQAFATSEADCRNCRRCIAACPEKAITVTPRAA